MTPLNHSASSALSAEQSTSNSPSGTTPKPLAPATLPLESERCFVKRAQGKTPKLEKILQELESFAAYDSVSGEFIVHSLRRGSRRKIGETLGCLNTTGYRVTYVGGSLRYNHQLTWLWFHGTWATFEIDHLNQIKDDNRVENLRDVPRSINTRNSSLRRDNITGYVGVQPHGRGFRSSTTANGKTVHHGTFPTIEEAAEARADYTAAHPELGFTPNHGE
jgi:hypothetical protein